MTEHETRVKVNMSVYVNVGTDSHPEDISEDIMKDILVTHVTDEIKSLDSESVDLAIDDWEFDEIKMFVDGEEQK
jgi:hypothetical protein